MLPLDHAILTPRLRVEPVTPRLAAAARDGGDAFAEALGAEAPEDWRASSLRLMGHAAPSSWSVAAPLPIRAVAVHRELGCVIGDVRFEPLPLEPELIEIGYSIARAHRRQGYAVEATGALIDWLFDAGGVRAAIAGCNRRNRASVGVLRKLGFWLDGSSGAAFWWMITPELRAEKRLTTPD
ncbi:MAG TPA: GNAT family N-acetyltransferase [Caulobacterales bacterium]|nr:GNAT family N-acetyltransferase [Caulobacterales bacterium]